MTKQVITLHFEIVTVGKYCGIDINQPEGRGAERCHYWDFPASMQVQHESCTLFNENLISTNNGPLRCKECLAATGGE